MDLAGEKNFPELSVVGAYCLIYLGVVAPAWLGAIHPCPQPQLSLQDAQLDRTGPWPRELWAAEGPLCTPALQGSVPAVPRCGGLWRPTRSHSPAGDTAWPGSPPPFPHTGTRPHTGTLLWKL